MTTDVGAAAGFFIGLAAFLRFLKNPTRTNVLVAGIAMGFAFLAKFSTFLLAPIAVALAIAWEVAQAPTGQRSLVRFRKRSGGLVLTAHLRWPSLRVAKWNSPLLRCLLRTAAVLLVGYLTIYPVYLHHTWNYPPEHQRQTTEQNLLGRGVGHTPKDIVIWMSDKPLLRPWAQYFFGLFEAILRATTGNNPYFLGRFYPTGLRSYFPVVYLIKEPLALHVLTLIALVFALGRIRRPLFRREWLRAHFTEFALGFVIAVYWFVSIRSNLNIGVRHLLPLLPFTYVLVSNQIAVLHRRLRKPGAILGFRLLLGSLIAWQAWSILRMHPSYLAYFNELAGGPDGGYRYVLDSNLDWGQDVKRLAMFVEQRGISQIHWDYFGKADPAYYLKDKYEPLRACEAPPKGWLAVSAMVYQGSPWLPVCDYRRWLPEDKIVAKIGYSIFVFHNE